VRSCVLAVFKFAMTGRRIVGCTGVSGYGM
jgi:hypothetical protein